MKTRGLAKNNFGVRGAHGSCPRRENRLQNGACVAVLKKWKKKMIAMMGRDSSPRRRGVSFGAVFFSFRRCIAKTFYLEENESYNLVGLAILLGIVGVSLLKYRSS